MPKTLFLSSRDSPRQLTIKILVFGEGVESFYSSLLFNKSGLICSNAKTKHWDTTLLNDTSVFSLTAVSCSKHSVDILIVRLIDEILGVSFLITNSSIINTSCNNIL